MKNNKLLKSALIMGIIAVQATTVMAAPVSMQPQGSRTISQQAQQDLKVGVSSVKYSDIVKGDGVVNFRVDLPTGVKLTTKNANVFFDAVTQNYDISLSGGTSSTGDSFFFNVNWANPGIEYAKDWVFNIEGSVFSDGKDRTFTVDVRNDLQAGRPLITTNVDKGVTVQQLTQGFDLVMNIENARFNTSCFGNYIRMSMMQSCGIKGLYPVAYCDSLRPNQVKLRVQAPNGVEYWRTHFEFTMEGNAIYGANPITVRIPIIR